MLDKEEDIKTLNSELQQWLNRCHDLKLKKGKNKAIKKSFSFANKRLLKQGE